MCSAEGGFDCFGKWYAARSSGSAAADTAGRLWHTTEDATTDSTGTDQAIATPFFSLQNYAGVGSGLSRWAPANLSIRNQGEGGLATNANAHRQSCRLKPGDYLFVGNNVPPLDTKAAKTVISYDDPMHFDMKLKGEHNQFNARFVYAISTQLFGCDPDKVREALGEFTGLRHRMQFAGNYDGVDYYDDSISTIPEAAIAAIRSIPNAGTILLGGMDRNIDYDILIDYIREHGEYNYILMYKSGERIYKEVGTLPYCRYTEDLQGAVALAKEITPSGKACILSPAAASYGYFKNFEERGDVFQQLVKN